MRYRGENLVLKECKLSFPLFDCLLDPRADKNVKTKLFKKLSEALRAFPGRARLRHLPFSFLSFSSINKLSSD